ncbi:protein eva-1 homolog A-like isoform 2-T9 [Salvelinus alpinus]|nr:protein eva-1 homolog A-like isoform X2 [Salvelinus namaycush]XP_038865825.1 protein eva-1 homolog A-like isoform X2 [Salvelinus namaycush]XP_038865826.1 protein eva-1 homolog A-like isoform X2 [Salvelinus namaycush]XP_038865828.1 protein eva-1 homolog A-like isoform X2 [Salvelinus namaycush]XP_038865829.1 protein eva-1 homolog A-like isoform X2 [Salvelinus namaycush]
MEVKVVSQEMALFSNALAAYTFIADQPERAALVFVSGVCVGLLLTLCALVVQIHCRTDCHYSNRRRHHHQHRNRTHHHHHGDHHCHHHHQPGNPNTGNPGVTTETSEDSESEDWDDRNSDLTARRRRRFERTLLQTSVFTSAEELERAQRVEERERIMGEIWMNGQPDVNTVTRSLNRYY